MIERMLSRSSATEPFKSAVEEFLANGGPNDRVEFDGRSPAVKVERVLTKLLESEPELEVAGVELNAASGCEFYRGDVTVRLADGAALRFTFDWDCKWRATQQGWTDYFGFPDQTRAAREFGYDCFRSWEAAGAEARAQV